MLKETWKSLFRKPATLRYPKDKIVPPEAARGRLECRYEDCIHCKICALVCPTGACTFNEKTTFPEFDLKLCMFCNMCVEKCPKKIITLTHDYEMATDKPEDLIVKSQIKAHPRK